MILPPITRQIKNKNVFNSINIDVELTIIIIEFLNMFFDKNNNNKIKWYRKNELKSYTLRKQNQLMREARSKIII